MEITSTTSQTTASGASASTEQLFENYEAFLQLLTTQLQHQDPLDPVDSAEYTNQLVQYAQVEQSIATNDNLESLISLVSANAATMALQYVGDTAEIDSAYAMMSDGTASWSYTLGSDAEDVTLQVHDEDGNLVYETTGDTSAGEHGFQWDGTTDDGGQAEDGIYSLTVTARDADGATIGVDISSFGTITGIDSSDGELIFEVGELRVSESALLGVRES